MTFSKFILMHDIFLNEILNLLKYLLFESVEFVRFFFEI